MDDTKKYWRDKVSQLLGWSTGLLLIFIGWSIDQHDMFELGKWSQVHEESSDTRDAAVRAILLIVFACIYVIALPAIVRSIYRRFLRDPTDETVLPERFAFSYAVVLSALTLVIALLTACL